MSGAAGGADAGGRARARDPLDLGVAFKDATLRKAAFGRACETVELTLRLLRRAIGARETERDRVAGLRFKGVRGLATEAVRWDRDAARWAPAKVDWLGALGRDAIEPPIVGGAHLDSPATLERWAKAAPDLLYLRGRPEDVVLGAYADAPALFEASAEVVLPNGWSANARLFVAADALEVAGARGPLAVPDVLRAAAEWTGRWQDYWARRERNPDLPPDPQYDWCEPGD